jgi:hypothetical protein
LRSWQFGFDIRKHPRQRDRQREEGAIEIRGGHFDTGFLCIGF